MRKKIARYFAQLGYQIKKKRTYDENEIVFLHIGKNAGTQIKHLAHQINQIDTRYKITWYGHRLILRDIPVGVPYFFSIRDPLSRFRSGFYSRKRKGQPHTYNEWKRAEHIAFSHFGSANQLAEALWTDGEHGAQAFNAMNAIGHINTHQLDWFRSQAYFLSKRPPLSIIRQEHFERDFDCLLRTLSISTSVRNLDVAVDPRLSHIYSYVDDPPLSEKAIENLKLWYARDVAFYNSCENWILDKYKDFNS